MKTINKLLLSIALLIAACQLANAQSIWTSVEVGGDVAKGLNLSGSADYRTHPKLKGSDRASIGLNLDYKTCKYFKLGAGYTFLNNKTLKEPYIDKNGDEYLTSPEWYMRHRAYFYLTGSYGIKGFKISLRERYQFTYRGAHTFPLIDNEGNEVSSYDKKAKMYHALRSRLSLEYKFQNFGMSIFATGELYNNLTQQFAIDKYRITAGLGYKINKQHYVELFYRYVDSTDIDDPDNHVIGIGYKCNLKKIK